MIEASGGEEGIEKRMRALLRRPWPVAILIGLAAEALFLVRLTTPHQPFFDETHYVPAARTLLALARPANTEHPLLGKEIIAAGMLLFGDGPFGWRIFSTLAATATVMGLFAILQLQFRRVRVSVVGAVLALLNFTVFVQARIAMLDGFETAFLMLSVATMIWAAQSPGPRVVPRWALGSALMAMAIAAKWAAVPFLAYAALAILWVRLADARRAGRPPIELFEMADGPLWPGLTAGAALAWLFGIAGAIYFATFLPAFFYAEDAMTLSSLLPFQAQMYAEQTQVLAPHPYQSPWYSWPADVRPIWYLYEQVDGAWRGVLMIGNPVIWWGGLFAAGVTVWRWAMGAAPAILLPVALWLGAFLPFALVPKSIGFMHYYYPASVFLAGVIAQALASPKPSRRFWRRDTLFVAAAGAVFVYFYPILSAAALPEASAFRQWMLLSTWP